MDRRGRIKNEGDAKLAKVFGANWKERKKDEGFTLTDSVFGRLDAKPTTFPTYE